MSSGGRLVRIHLRPDMIILLLVFGVAVAQRGHYIVDYQRLPLYQEFYLSPGVYRPFFPAKHEPGPHEARKVDIRYDQQSSSQATAKHLHHHKQQQHQHQVQQQQQQQQAIQQQQPQPQKQQALQEQPQQPVAQQLVQEQAAVVQDSTVVVAAQEPTVVVSQEQPAVVVNAEQPATPSAPVLKYSNSMTPDGSYSYKYETADGLMREETSVMEPAEDGRMVASVKGSYSYPGPDGRTIRVDYIADEGGFRASGDHLPQTLQDTVYNFKYIVPS